MSLNTDNRPIQQNYSFKNMRILVIEDEKKVAGFIASGLRQENYIVDVEYNGIKGIETALINSYDVILLDSMLPDKNGLEVLKELQKNSCKSKIMMVTAKDATNDVIEGLDKGADDYLIKPFDFGVLLARIRALIRKSGEEKDGTLTASDLVMNLHSRKIFRGKKEILLSAREFTLLEYFLRNKNKLITRTTLTESVWDMNFDTFSNVIDVYVSYLRNKIDKGFAKPLIHTLRGQGYILRDDD